MSFQNLDGAKQSLRGRFSLDLAAGLTGDEWKAAVRSFQKRHLLSHKMGVVDEEYIRRSGDTLAVAGRKIAINAEQVREIVRIVRKLAVHVSGALAST